MRQATRVLPSTPGLSHLDRRDWARETFRTAHAMARRVIIERPRHSIGAAWTYFLLHARRRFCTPAAWRLAQLAGRIVFDQRTPTHGTAGGVDVLLRQGLVRRTRRPRPGNLLGLVPYRCSAVDRVRAVGLTFAWSADPLASSANRGLRLHRAQRRREVARIMAQDRFALTVVGVLALREAEAARTT